MLNTEKHSKKNNNENYLTGHSKKIFQIVILAVVFGLGFFAFSAEARAAINGVLRVPSGSGTNPRYFTDDTGKAIYLTGSHTWNGLVDGGPGYPPPTFNYDNYLSFLNSYNHNFIRLWRLEPTKMRCPGDSLSSYTEPHPWLRSNVPGASDGGNKFDLTQPNQAYFDRLRSRVLAARDQNIYVAIMLFEGYDLQFCRLDGDANFGYPFNYGNNINNIDGRGLQTHTLQNPAVTLIQETYIKKVIDTVNDLDNVLYEIANEDGGGSKEWQYYMINFIKDYEAYKPKKHPAGMTFRHPSGTNTELFASPADWISPSNFQSDYTYRDNPIPTDGSKVILLDTDHLWGIGGDRIWVWKSFARGYNTLFMDNPNDSNLINNTDFKGARKAMGHTLTYANKMNLKAMIPSSNSSNCSTTYCLRNPGWEYLVYQPLSGSFTVNLAAGDYNYEWFNPATGLVAGTGTVTASGGSKSFSLPTVISGDAILYLKIIDAVWTYCANEGQQCNFSGTKEVRYGASNSYYYKTLSNGTLCANSVFGDPINGISKSCYYRIASADVNSDGSVNSQDITLCVNVILEIEKDSAIVAKAKAVAEDLSICDVLDLQAIVNKILGG